MRASADPSGQSPMRRLAILGLVFVAAILSCGKDVTGPLSAAGRFVRGFSWEPIFPAAFQAAGGAGSGLVQFNRVHVVLHHSDGTIALDTTIDFPAGADSLTLELTVKLLNDAPATGEPMTLTLGYLNAAGDTVFKGGPVSVTASPPPAGGGSNPPVQVPVSYTGTGSSATSVAISPRSGTVVSGAGFSFSAVAKDVNGVTLAGTPIIWNSLDPSIATITSAAAGNGLAQNQRGTARIIAQLLTGPADTVQLFVLLPASNIVAQSGNGQFGVVGTQLALPLVVKVAATDGVGVAGTTVHFAVATGGGSVGSASAVSDANGLAQTTFKLGTGTGAQTVTATAAGLNNSPVTFIDTAQAAAASKLVVTTQPVSGVAGTALTAIVVTAEDNNGNIATTFTGPVAVAFGANGAAATLGGTTTVNAFAGVATFSTLTVNKNGTAYTLVASSTGLTSATTSAFDIAVGTPNKLVFTVQPAGAIANVAMSPAIVVNAQDSQGNPTSAFTGAVTLGFATNPTGATLGGTLTVNAVAGAATFAGISVSTSGSGYALSASATGLTSATSATFTTGGGVATTIAVASGAGQTGPPSAALALPVVIQVTDAGANPIAGTAVNFAVLTGGGSVAPPSGVTNAAGQVQTTWTLGASPGAQTISATSAGLSGSPLTIAATAAFAPATQLKFTTQPANAAAATSIAPAIVVTAKDAGNNLAGSFVGNVTLSIGTNPGGSTLGGTLTVAAVAGVATFNNITLNQAGTGYTLGAASGALTSAVSNTFNITTGTASAIAVSAGQAQSGLVSTLLSTPLAVLVTDANANPVSGTTVNWLVVTGGGSVSVASSVTNASGIATTAWTLGVTAGPQSVSATAAGLTGSPLTFTASATLAIANRIWTGAGGTAWTTAASWSPAVVPGATDSVFIPAGGTQPIIQAPVSVTHLYTATGSVVTVANFATVTVSGNLDAGSFFGGATAVVNLTGNGTLKGTMTASLNLNGGTHTLAGALTVSSAMTLNGGSLVMNGQAAVVQNFATFGSSTLTMTNAADALIVANATFGGGNETGLLTAGNLFVTGNFTQASGSTSFIAAAAHTTTLNGTAAQTVNFANPFPSTFGAVVFANAAGVTLQTNMISNGAVTVSAGAVSGTAIGFTIGGTLNDPGALLAVPSISFTGSTAPVAATTPTINANVTFNNNPSILAGNLTVNGAVNVDGNLQLNSHYLVVNGTFGTLVAGQLTMTNAADSMSVTGTATFGGGSTGGILTNGKLKLAGSFLQVNNGSGQEFSASGTHTTLFTGTTPTVSFANPTTSSFGRVQVQTSVSMTFSTDVRATGDVWLKTGSTPSVTNAGGTVTIGGALYDSTGGRWQVANTTMAGTGPLPRSLNTNLTITGALTLTDSLKLTGVANNLAIGAGSLTLGGHYVSVPGTFSTTGTGTFVMTSANDTLVVKGNASFNGGSTAGKLTNGLFEFDGGSFSQGTTSTAFSADAPHVTYFWGLTPQTVSFANPAAGSSHFGNLYLGDTATVLASDSYLNGQFQTGIVISHRVGSTGADHLLTSNGANMRNTAFDNVRWKVAGTNGNGLFPSIDNVVFKNISNTAAPQFDFEYSVTTNLTLSSFSFNTTPTGGGSYIKVVGPDTLTISGVFPSANGGFLSISGGGAVNGWPNTATWTGAATTSAWNTAGNWDINAVPSTAADVVINSGIYQPTTGGAVTVHNLTVNSGATLTVTGANMTVNGDIVVQPSAAIALTTSNVGIIALGNVTTDTAGTTGVTVCSGPSSAALNLQTGTHNVTGKFCNLSIFGTYTATGPIQVVGSGATGTLSPGNGGSLKFNGHRIDVGAYSSTSTGTITMQNSLDSLLIHGGTSYFQGGSETGLMTKGTVVDRAPNLIVSGTGFDASGGSQTLVVDTAFFQTLTWATAPTPGHGFNNVTMMGTSSKGFAGDQWITGTLLFDASMVGPGTVAGSYNIHVNTLVDNSLIYGGAFNGSTSLHITGNGTFTRDTLRVNTIWFDGGGNFTLSHNLITSFIVVDSSSSLILNGHRVDTQGNYFTTQNGGVLNMTTAGDSLIANRLFFIGGSTSGLLTQGGISVTGAVQGQFFVGYDATRTAVVGASATSFAATGTRVWFAPSFVQQVAFKNPGTGAAGSHFGFVQATNAAPITVFTNVFVDSLLTGEQNGATWVSDSAAQGIVRTITTKGIYNSGTFGLALQGVNVVLNDGPATSTFFNSVTWTNFPTAFTGDVFTVNRSDTSALEFYSHDFSGVTLGTGGHYLHNLGSANIWMVTPLPNSVTLGVEILKSGTGTITWPYSP